MCFLQLMCKLFFISIRCCWSCVIAKSENHRLNFSSCLMCPCCFHQFTLSIQFPVGIGFHRHGQRPLHNHMLLMFQIQYLHPPKYMLASIFEKAMPVLSSSCIYPSTVQKNKCKAVVPIQLIDLVLVFSWAQTHRWRPDFSTFTQLTFTQGWPDIFWKRSRLKTLGDAGSFLQTIQTPSVSHWDFFKTAQQKEDKRGVSLLFCDPWARFCMTTLWEFSLNLLAMWFRTFKLKRCMAISLPFNLRLFRL